MIPSNAVREGTLRELRLIVDPSLSPTAGWDEIVKWVSARATIEIAQISSADIEQEVANVTEQLRAELSKHPLSAEIQFLYFGLYEMPDRIGFYVSGGEQAPENPNALTECSLTCRRRLYLRSELLDGLLRRSKELPELDSWFSYALMWGAAAILSKFAVQGLCLNQEILVGFDSGDVERISKSAQTV